MLLNRKIFFGVIIGIFCTLTVIWIYRTLLVDKTATYSITLNSSDSTTNKINIKDVIKELESTDNTVEKITSINKRLDDVLIFGGVIVTLLLAISLGVYVKAESEVEKHFRDNFDGIRAKVNDHLVQIEQAASKAQSELEIVTTLRKRVEKPQTITE